MEPAPNLITQLLMDWRGGDSAALEKLAPIVYEEMRRIARRYMKGERAGHTLQTSALVNEAYMRLVDHNNIQWENRAHFFAVAAQAMRRVLVDHARNRNYQKRGGGAHKVEFDEAWMAASERAAEFIALNDALTDLENVDPRKGKVVEMRYFGGLSVEETAEALGVSPITVKRDWNLARAWLLRALTNK